MAVPRPTGPGAAGTTAGGVDGPRRLRTGAVLLVLAVAVLAIASLVTVADPRVTYVWPLSMISDLGAGTCFTADGRWICSPRARLFNAGLVLTGALLVAAAGVLGRRWGRGQRAAVLAAAIGLVLLAVFPSDAAPRLHLAAAVVALPGASALLLVSGVLRELPGVDAATRSPRHRPATVLRASLAALSLLATIAHLMPEWRIRGAAELVSLVALVLAVLAEAELLRRSARSGRASLSGLPGGPDPTG